MQYRRRALVCIPANHKWFRDLAISEILVETMEGLKIQLPEPTVNIANIRRKYHKTARKEKVEKQRKKS